MAPSVRTELKGTLLMLSTLLLAAGCGGESADAGDDGSNDTTSSPTNTSTMGGSGGSTVSSTSEASSASTGGATGGSTHGGATTGGPSPDCSGDFGEPVLLFTGDVTAPQSFTLSPDELEILYVDYPDDVRIIQRRVRSSKSASFGPAETVLELLDVCPSVSAALAVGTVDLSPDGLTAYIACEEDVSLPTTLVTATRTALGSSFTPDLTLLGSVGASFATADGLEAEDQRRLPIALLLALCPIGLQRDGDTALGSLQAPYAGSPLSHRFDQRGPRGGFGDVAVSATRKRVLA